MRLVAAAESEIADSAICRMRTGQSFSQINGWVAAGAASRVDPPATAVGERGRAPTQANGPASVGAIARGGGGEGRKENLHRAAAGRRLQLYRGHSKRSIVAHRRLGGALFDRRCLDG